MKLRVVVYGLYQYFVQKFHNLDQVIDNRTENADQTITDFLLELHKTVGLHSVGPKYIYTYLIFQFDYWSSKEVQFGDRITIKRVFGKKSLLRFQQRSTEFSWYNAKLNLSKFDISEQILLQYKSKKLKDFSKIDPQEEIEKARNLNTNDGLQNCIDSTTLFNHRSSNCATCKFNSTCKKLLKGNYLGIYIDRGYDG